MSACEWCWREASRRAGLLGGSTADRYIEVLDEQQKNPTCPELLRLAQEACEEAAANPNPEEQP